MKHRTAVFLALPIIASFSANLIHAVDHEGWMDPRWKHSSKAKNIQLGPRPYFLVNDMEEGKLKKKLESCSEGRFRQMLHQRNDPGRVQDPVREDGRFQPQGPDRFGIYERGTGPAARGRVKAGSI